MHHEVGVMRLDSVGVSGDAYHRPSIPRSSIEAKPLETTYQRLMVKDSPRYMSQCTARTSGISSQSTDLTLDHSASCQSSTQAVQHTALRQRPKMSNVTPIPTALVTPLPGTSPPHYTHELHTHDRQPGSMKTEEVDGEDRQKGKGWKVVGSREEEFSGVSGLPMEPGDSTVELIEKWKALIDTKDRIMKQKNVQIERYMYSVIQFSLWCCTNGACTCMLYIELLDYNTQHLRPFLHVCTSISGHLVSIFAACHCLMHPWFYFGLTGLGWLVKVQVHACACTCT